MSEILIIAIALATFILGLIAGCVAALLCVRFAIKAATEIRKGNQGLFKEKDNADAELDASAQAEIINK